MALPWVLGADSVNLGGGYERGRVAQAYPVASIWVQALYLGDDPESTKREWSH